MKQLSAVIISYNEEEKIETMLRSVKPVADEIVVMDAFSSDATPEICRRYTDRFLQRTWQGYRNQKQCVTEQASHDWVLSLDSDEAVSPELGKELLSWKQKNENGHRGYYLPRKTLFLGRWIQHTTWYPDWQLRLFRRSCGRWEGGRIHESFRVLGPTGRFQSHLYHYSYATLSEYLHQLETFSSLAAADYLDQGVKARWAHLLLHPPAVWGKNYLLRLGFLDGVPGLAVSTLSAISTFFKFLTLWELERRRTKEQKNKRGKERE